MNRNRFYIGLAVATLALVIALAWQVLKSPTAKVQSERSASDNGTQRPSSDELASPRSAGVGSSAQPKRLDQPRLTPRQGASGTSANTLPTMRSAVPKKLGVLRAPPRGFDTSPSFRPIGEKLEHQEIPPQATSVANTAYDAFDRREYELARRAALKLLAASPDNISMKRVAIASSCRLGDTDAAGAMLSSLKEFDSDAMIKMCADMSVKIGP